MMPPTMHAGVIFALGGEPERWNFPAPFLT
jgi:hypothetical protein